MASIEIAPTSVAVDGAAIGFQFYSHGIYNDETALYPCGNDLDHGVLAVGYGTENG